MPVITQQLMLVLPQLGRAHKTKATSAGCNAGIERKNQQKKNELWVS
jgi:hypothetical protein